MAVVGSTRSKLNQGAQANGVLPVPHVVFLILRGTWRASKQSGRAPKGNGSISVYGDRLCVYVSCCRCTGPVVDCGGDKAGEDIAGLEETLGRVFLSLKRFLILYVHWVAQMSNLDT